MRVPVRRRKPPEVERERSQKPRSSERARATNTERFRSRRTLLEEALRPVRDLHAATDTRLRGLVSMELDENQAWRWRPRCRTLNSNFGGWRELEDSPVLFSVPAGFSRLTTSVAQTWLLRQGWSNSDDQRLGAAGARRQARGGVTVQRCRSSAPSFPAPGLWLL
jgi:hypothetical protein